MTHEELDKLPVCAGDVILHDDQDSYRGPCFYVVLKIDRNMMFAYMVDHEPPATSKVEWWYMTEAQLTRRGWYSHRWQFL